MKTSFNQLYNNMSWFFPRNLIVFILIAIFTPKQSTCSPFSSSSNDNSEILTSIEALEQVGLNLAEPPPPQHTSSRSSGTNEIITTKSNSVHVVNECVMISMEEGVFHYKSKGIPDTCGVYFLADPDKSIRLTVEYLYADCQQQGLISIVDGWELNGQLFPSIEDHEKGMEERFHEYCGRRKIHQSFTSSQNAALIQYRIPTFGQGFSLRVQHVPNPRPCNVLVQDTDAAFSLQNYGRKKNCSLTVLFDAKIRLLYMNTGLETSSQVNPFGFFGGMIGTLHKCEKLGLGDYVQLGGSSGIDTSRMKVIDEFCGHQLTPVPTYTTIFCGMTTVRLVSSGKYYNKVVVEVHKAGIEDLDDANFICDL